MRNMIDLVKIKSAKGKNERNKTNKQKSNEEERLFFGYLFHSIFNTNFLETGKKAERITNNVLCIQQIPCNIEYRLYSI